jgi:ectoine hydroxylase-related dioxygenase (phytanoyl-CoA dioxygenase family)
VLGPNVELFQFGQVLVKEPVGGHPKMLHQDAAYFEHKYDGPMACLSYTVDCDRNNGCLHVVPGSHELGILRHVDTESHLGLDKQEWPWEKALPITGQAGDAVFFHVKTIHGSKPNHSQAPRPVFIHRYRRADDYVVVNAATAAKREEAEKHREEAKKENQLGLMVSGERVYDPER